MAFLVQEGLDRLDHGQGVLALGLGHLEQGGAVAVEDELVFIQLEAVADGGDVAQAQFTTAAAGPDHHQLAELGRGAAQVGEAQQQGLGGGLQGAGRQVDALAGDGAGHVLHADAVLAQDLGRNRDPQLVLGEALDLDHRDLGQ